MKPHTVTILANWLAQASQGGYWQAAAKSLAKDQGITIKMKSGGPQIQTVTNVAIGDADYGMTAADNLLEARSQGIPVVGLFAAYDSSPQCLMSHASANIKTFKDLNGMQISVSPAGAFWPYIKAKYNIKPAKTLPTVPLGTFASNPQIVRQCFIGSEPFTAEQKGWDTNFLMVSKSGYNPYTQVLFTLDKRIKNHPREVAAVVKASREGWKQFTSGDAQTGIDAIVKANPDYSKAQAEYGIKMINEKHLMGDPIGAMKADRWKATYDVLVNQKVITNDFDWKDTFTTKFLPKG